MTSPMFFYMPWLFTPPPGPRPSVEPPPTGLDVLIVLSVALALEGAFWVTLTLCQ